MEFNKVILGDSLKVLKTFPDNFFDTVITDPPYGLSNHSEKIIRNTLSEWLNGNDSFVPDGKGFIGKSWDSFVPPPALWREVFRVVKPGATVLVFAGSRSQDLMTLSLRLAGFEIKDTLMWFYGSGFPKATDISKQIDKIFGVERTIIGKGKAGKGFNKIKGFGKITTGSDKYTSEWELTAPATPEAKLWDGYKSHGLKPAYEPIIMAIKPNDGSYAQNALKWDVAGLNIDAGRIGMIGGVKKVNIEPNSTSHNGEGFGCNGKLEQLNKGRFPANILFDEESAEMLDEQTRGMVGNGHWAKTKVSGYGDFGNGKSEYFGIGVKDYYKGGASRFFYVAKASNSERNKGLDNFPIRRPDTRTKMGLFDEKGIQPQQNFHPTVKPVKLIEYLVKLTKMPNENQVYLDPFFGSGTTGIAVLKQGRKFIGIENNEEYYKIALARTNHVKKEEDKKTNLEKWF